MTMVEASGSESTPVSGAQAPGTGRRLASPAKKKRTKNDLRKWGEIAFFVGPGLILFLTFVVYPVLSAARYSFYKWNGISQFSDAEFIGLDNYDRAIFGPGVFKTAYSEPFYQALGHNFLIIALSMLIQLPLALLIALALNRKFAGRGAMRLIIFAPYVLSEVIAGVMWFIIFDPQGIATEVSTSLGITPPAGGWFEDQTFGIWTVFFIVTWKYLGLAIILFLAGLSGIPEELHDAAAIDGASWWQIQRRVNIPMIGPTIRIWVFLSIIGSIQLFDMVWVLNEGGTTNQYSTIATYMMQKGYFRNDVGYGSAISVIMFLISLVIAIGYMVFVLRRDNSSETGKA